MLKLNPWKERGFELRFNILIVWIQIDFIAAEHYIGLNPATAALVAIGSDYYQTTLFMIPSLSDCKQEIVKMIEDKERPSNK